MSEYLSCCEHLQAAIGANLHKHIRGKKKHMPGDPNSTERKAAIGKNKIAHTFKFSLFLSFHFQNLCLSEPCLVVCKFVVALNDYLYEQMIK